MSKPQFQDVLTDMATIVANYAGYSLPEAKKWGLRIREDSNEWSSNDDAYIGFIMWEEGPYEWADNTWPINMENPITRIIGNRRYQFYMQPITSWGLTGIYYEIAK